MESTSKTKRHELLKTAELRRPMKDTVDLPLYTIHMGPEFPSTWDFGWVSPPLPAGIFGSGSDPWSGSISCVGDPLDPKGAAPTADLVVRHEKIRWVRNKESRFGPPEVPESYQLRCQMVQLSELGTEPVTVTYNGGQRPEKWNVRVELAKRHPGGGMIYITHLHNDGNGGLVNVEIAVKVSFVFSRSGEEVVVDSGIEWLSETNLNFVRWAEPQMSERFFIPEESAGNFIPATANLGGRTQLRAACSKNRAVAHSFILAPVRSEVKGEWGTFGDVWQFPERKG